MEVFPINNDKGIIETWSQDFRPSVATYQSPVYGDGWQRGFQRPGDARSVGVGTGGGRSSQYKDVPLGQFPVGSNYYSTGMLPEIPDLMPTFPDVVVQPIAPIDMSFYNPTFVSGSEDITNVCVAVNFTGTDPGTLSEECNTTEGNSEVVALPVDIVTNLRINGSDVVFDKIDGLKFWLTKDRVGRDITLTLNIYYEETADNVLLTIANCPA